MVAVVEDHDVSLRRFHRAYKLVGHLTIDKFEFRIAAYFLILSSWDRSEIKFAELLQRINIDVTRKEEREI